MLRKSVLVGFCVALLAPALSALAGMDPTLMVYWPLDEQSGNIAKDLSGNGNDGTISAGPTWVAGKLGGALRFAGAGDVRGRYVAMNNRSFTVAMWMNPVLGASQIVFSQVQSGATGLSMHMRVGGPSTTDAPVNGLRFGFYNIDLDSPANILQSNNWYHVAFWYDFAAQRKRIYINGVQVAENTSTGFLATTGSVCLGSWTGSSYFNGMVDDFQLYQKALSPAEVTKIMSGLADASLAGDPSPKDAATDVHQDAVLSWTAGEFAASHDVYFGTSAVDVNSASRTNPMGVLVSQGQTGAEYDPQGLLDFGQTYYWRVDEVNAPPSNTIFKGEVWSFTAEPYSYPITAITAKASSAAQATMGPEKTINGVGLNANDQHSTNGAEMWTAVLPAWIQYEFDKVYKLDKLLVWNSNQIIEAFVGFGAKNVKIEYSVDGENWIELPGVPEFAQGTGTPTYTANTTVDFAGTEAKFVKLTITKNWGTIGQGSLAEVRFYAAPVLAREPFPATGATGIGVGTDLDWRPGRGSTSHKVFLGTDGNSVAASTTPTGTVALHGFTPSSLNFATKYFWRVDEVTDAGTYTGDVWDFTTLDYAPIDNMESYTDDEGSRIYEAWVDGVTNTVYGGSTVGYMTAPFAEKTVVRSGAQSMPLTYDNSASPFISETERTFTTPQNWTTNGASTVSLWYQGASPAFVSTPSGSILMNGQGADIWGVSDQFRYAYKTLTGNGTIIARLHSLYQSDGWAKAGVMIRQSVEPGSTHAFMAMTASSGNGASFQRRLATAGDSANTDAPATAPVPKPYWVKVERVGDSFSGYLSPDGVTWTQLGTAVTIPMTGPVLIGLAVCSHNAGVATGAEFSDLKTTGNVSAADWALAEIGLTQPAGNSVEGLYLTVKDSAGKSKTLQCPDTIATARAGWQQWQIPLSDLTAAGVKTNAVKSIVVGVGTKASPVKGGPGKIYIDDIGYGVPLP
ncbi:MAG TPA: LamG-like jellyroll fold domain-containing protein [Sedimentisphaerales bacterium]|nr:LamG-like jellyroll fold domain-containing protein [Sedimentisphaerales bacterium]